MINGTLQDARKYVSDMLDDDLLDENPHFTDALVYTQGILDEHIELLSRLRSKE